MKRTLIWAGVAALTACEEGIEEDVVAWTPSYVSITSHGTGDETFEETLRLRGSSSDEASVTWTNGERSGPAERRFESFWLWGFYYSGWVWDADIPLTVGENTIVVVGTLPDGASSREEIVVLRKRRVIEWGEGLAGRVSTPTFTIFGRVNPPGGREVAEVLCWTTARPQDVVRAQGTLDWSADVPLPYRYTTIVVAAFDSQGLLLGERSFDVIRDDSP